MIKVFVMETCPDCTQIKKLLKDNPKYKIIDIGKHVSYLKEFLKLRDSSPAFDSIKVNGSIGIPCFVMENGDICFSLDDIAIEEGASCSLDGTGC